ncbi:E-selectin-like [Branchiostoma lanceolatum]|uniref:E-selectin-like n=1 Tax=Branchiostoma lanceolatum TaxID=7740 RepID=UPI00345609EF
MTGLCPHPLVATFVCFIVFLSQCDVVKSLSGDNVCSRVEEYGCKVEYQQEYTVFCISGWGNWFSCPRHRIAYRAEICKNTIYYCCHGYEESGDSCVPKSCGAPNPPAHGRVNGTSDHRYGAVVTFACEDGFVPVGSAERTCQADQTWSGTDFYCHNPCPDGYIRYNEVCLKFSDDKQPYESAKHTCQEEGANLVVIKTPAMNKFIENTLRAKGIAESDHTWIGLDRRSGQWEWSDASGTSGYNNWATDGHCAEIRPQLIFKWNDHNCDANNNFICQKDSCRDGYTRVNETCLKFSNEKKPYQNARETCQEEGANLVIMKTAAMTNNVERFIRMETGTTDLSHIWIGLDDLRADGQWQWSDGSNMSAYNNWYPGQPDIADEHCAEIWPKLIFKWNATSCAVNNHFICQKVVQCPRPTAPANGTMDSDSDSNQVSDEFIYQNTVHFTCNPGYKLAGEASLTCQADGSWTSSFPTCAAVPCPQPDVPANGRVTSGSDSYHDMVNFVYQDTVHFTCDLGYELEGAASATCQSDRTWSNSFPKCTRTFVLCTFYLDET